MSRSRLVRAKRDIAPWLTKGKIYKPVRNSRPGNWLITTDDLEQTECSMNYCFSGYNGWKNPHGIKRLRSRPKRQSMSSKSKQ